MGIYDKKELRLTVEGILYRLRVGCPWRDLPREFGNWNAIYRRFNEWSSKGTLLTTFKSLIKNPDLEWEFMDASYVKAHQHCAGAASTEYDKLKKNYEGMLALACAFIWLPL